jgi:hypothetical protein
MKVELERVISTEGLSKNSFEILDKIVNNWYYFSSVRIKNEIFYFFKLIYIINNYNVIFINKLYYKNIIDYIIITYKRQKEITWKQKYQN